jgi:hypothetical protein
MTVHEVLFWLFAVSVPAVGLVVLARLVWSTYRACRASRFGVAALFVLAMVGLAGLFVAVAAVWFGYGVAHSKKDLWSDLKVVLLTGVPYYLGSYGLWRLAGRFRSPPGSPDAGAA